MSATILTDSAPDRIDRAIKEFFRSVEYAEWKGQTVAVKLDTETVIRGASCEELRERFGPNFAVICFGTVDTALRPRRVG